METEKKNQTHFILKDVDEKIHSVDIEGDKFEVAKLIAQAYFSDMEAREVISIAMRIVHTLCLEVADEQRAAQMNKEE